jgi:hypothetical protein
MNIVEKLDRLAELQAAPDAIRLQKQALIDTILTDEIKAKLAEIDAEFSDPLRAAELQAAELADEIKAEIIAGGQTVKGNHLMAVYVKGREGGWDSAKLKGFAMAHPEIMAAKKPDGEPTVSFRRV